MELDPNADFLPKYKCNRLSCCRWRSYVRTFVVERRWRYMYPWVAQAKNANIFFWAVSFWRFNSIWCNPAAVWLHLSSSKKMLSPSQAGIFHVSSPCQHCKKNPSASSTLPNALSFISTSRTSLDNKATQKALSLVIHHIKQWTDNLECTTAISQSPMGCEMNNCILVNGDVLSFQTTELGSAKGNTRLPLSTCSS